MSFPVDVSQYKPLELDPKKDLKKSDLETLKANIQLWRDTIVFYTAIAGIRGMAGHTGGAYDIVPEALIAESFMRGTDRVYPVHFDEAGHRVALQYALAAFRGKIAFEKLLHYREYGHGLFGHPERDEEMGVDFSSGRLGHMWPFVNGVARAHPDKAVVLYGSDGSQMEGNDAEAARLAVAQQFNVKLFIDDNDVTISGHPSEYLPRFDVARTLEGHGVTVDTGEGEDIEALYQRMQMAFTTDGPVALINKRPMAVGIPDIEGTHAGHDVIPRDAALKYLRERGLDDAVAYLESVEKPSTGFTYLGSSEEKVSNRSEFGKIVNDILSKMPAEERPQRVLVVDSDLEGSTGIKAIRQEYPEVFINGGVQERGNVSCAAGFGYEKNRQGIFSTFSAFLEMTVSETTMARLNDANLICHYSHAGVDEIADNTCHYGINVFFGLSHFAEGPQNWLYFPADAHQLRGVVENVWNDPGVRFVFTNRSKLPYILKEDGTPFYGDGYSFVRGKDEVIREGSAGYVVSYGEMLHRSLDAVDRLRMEGLNVGLIAKPTLNAVDEDMMKKVGSAPFVLLVEGQNRNTGLGVRYGTWLLERGLTPKYDHMGVVRPGNGGIPEHIDFQGLAPEDIREKIQGMAQLAAV